MVIYDFGANKGQNLKYYLSKGHTVVALEANPVLCDQIRAEFSDAIGAGKLHIVNSCLTVHSENELVDFYIHNTNSFLSQFTKPSYDKIDDFHKIEINSEKASSIIRKYGEPYFIKIDIEHSDLMILKEILDAGILPNYISVEAHDPEILTVLLNSKYKFFNAVKGWNLKRFYPEFGFHTAGPFGKDLLSPWLDRNGIKALFKMVDFGWIDIHATTETGVNVGELDNTYYKKYREPLTKNLVRRKIISIGRKAFLFILPASLFRSLRRVYKKSFLAKK